MPINSYGSENDQDLKNMTQLLGDGNNITQKEESNKTIVNDLKKENQELREKIQEFKYLEEELMAKRVEEKAKKRLISSLTFVGILLTLFGIIGFKSFYDYSKNLVTKKLESVSEQQINTIIQEEGKQQVAMIVEQQRDNFEDLMVDIAKQQINQITVATNPVGGYEKRPIFAKTTPRQVDFTSFMTPVRDMGAEGSIVGFAVAAALEYQIYKKLRKEVIISPRYLYYYAKLEGNFNPHSDTGAHIKDAIRVLETRGAVSEDVWPYKAGDLESNPPEAAETAEKYKIVQSFQLTTIEEIKSALQQYGPVVAGISMFDSSLRSIDHQKGNWPDPAPGDVTIGTIAICIVGYDDDKGLIKFKNSWGMGWGDEGYGFLSYSYVKKFLSDTWIFTL